MDRCLCLLGDTNDQFNYHLFNAISKNKKCKLFSKILIIFSKKSKKEEIKKIINIFNKKKTFFFQEGYPHRNKNISKLLKNKNNTLISLSFPNLLRPSFLNFFNFGRYNIHPGLIQFNRGCHSVFWSIYNDQDFGCTLHELTPVFDKGKIFDQIKIINDKKVIASEIFRKVHFLRVKILKRNLKKILCNRMVGKKLSTIGKYYNKKAISKITTLRNKQHLKVENFLKLIRATSIGDNSLFIASRNQKVKIKLIISYEKKIKI
jgi:methionyl-tRNA formyltransferase